jgi:hypothetical protein
MMERTGIVETRAARHESLTTKHLPTFNTMISGLSTRPPRPYVPCAVVQVSARDR